MSREYGGIDRFRVFAALFVVAAHTYPLASVSEELNFIVVHIFARINVPFFLMVTGYFLSLKTIPIGFVKKTGLIYAGAILLYLPIGIYAGYYAEGSLSAAILRNIVFDGTFYHLWYLPASLIGVLLLYCLGRRLSIRAVLAIAGFLYMIGLLGDSYYGITANVPLLNAVYDAMFNVFSYTRNGLFYAPLFLALGAMIAQSDVRLNARMSSIGFGLSMLVLLVEGLILRNSGFPRHDSMYIALIPCMVFLFQLLLTRKGKSSPLLRDVSLWIYILHPLCIIAVRGVARVTGLWGLLVDNSLIHYIAVCLASGVAAVVIAKLQYRRKPAALQTGRAWIELDMNALRYNVSVLKNLLPDGCRLMPAVKSKAYGHGAIEIAKELNACGVRAFCVVTVWEGVELRKHRVKGEILILGYTHPEQFPLLRRYRLTQTVVDYEYAVLLNSCGKKNPVHIKIDTGMRRLGERSDNMEKILQFFTFDNLDITGIYTHLCVADSDREADTAFTQAQMDTFNNILSRIEEHGFKRPKTHIHSSYGVIRNLENPYDYARVGIALYGMLSNRNDTEKWGTGLRPVLSVRVRVCSVKTLYAGESAGYGLAFTAVRDMRIAILTIGYADGIPRSLSCGVGYVLINGRKAPIVGRVCMDHITVDVTGIENVNGGDVAVLIGKSGDFEISACDIAEWAGTISNEILSRLGGRLDKCNVRQTKHNNNISIDKSRFIKV